VVRRLERGGGGGPVGDTPDAAHRLAREMLTRFHRDTYRRDRSDTVALERRVAFRLDPEVTFVGFADRVGRTHQGRLFVVDYKTSRNVGDASDFSEGLQAAPLRRLRPRRARRTGGLAGYHYLRHGSTSWHAVGRGRRLELLERCRGLVSEVLAAVDHPPGRACSVPGAASTTSAPRPRCRTTSAGGLEHARRSG